ncbi:Glutamate-1-semialdehyde 2,1-aminomutase [Methylobacterium crusticola]|uniref:Glutamate-1-semialdehyde 2,1-aminomutase n=1 Tax=Methylobacterium crusticola TaxID=1697972 RepID=A0ABQ4R4D9_9HYPH|nr:aminotransferase class III-fold pyridoxal phosphate-dependent enzyme [Methylobacterium crusticola]GJD52527.1 Glutamate-1-semialdehyde 2,1-aminomutase [Methylobacterium crusticola]
MTSAPLAPLLGRRAAPTNVEADQLADARDLFPGGVLGGNALPDGCAFVVSHGAGGRFWDTSGNEYIDYVLGSGSLFLGHAHPRIQAAVAEQAGRGTHFFAYLNETAVAYGRRLKPLVRCAERMRFTTAGSDSTFHAIRLARAFMGRDRIVKFEGAYHGVHDYAQVSTSPGSEVPFPTAVPDTAGIPGHVADLTLVAQWNDIESLKAILEAHGREIAAVIMEPIQRILSPKPGFLHAVRELTRAHDVLLILDEVVTGFRYGLGGAQDYFDITPDLATYGKIIGGGLPVGAVMGRADIMEQADPAQKGRPSYVYQNGTLQGHPLGCAAGLAMLDILSEEGVYDRVFALADRLRAGLQEIFDRHRMGVVVFGEGPMWHFLFADEAPSNYRDIRRSDLGKLRRFEAEMIRNGLFVLPNNRRFVSIAHTDDDLAATFAAIDHCCRALLA